MCHQTWIKAMSPNDILLQLVERRVRMWQDELQSAFRRADAAKAAECMRVLEEYNALTSDVLRNSCFYR